jgi:nuclear pore complex protein Nup121
LVGSVPLVSQGGKGSTSLLHASAHRQPTFGWTSVAPTTQATSTGTSSYKLGGCTRAPFVFGGSVAPADHVGFRDGKATPVTSSTSGSFSFRVGQGGTTGSSTSFVAGLSQNALDTGGQSAAFAFKVASRPERKALSRDPYTPSFSHSTLPLGVGASCLEPPQHPPTAS